MTDYLLSAEKALLLVIDIQEKFQPILSNAEAVIENTRRLITGCNQLNVPVIVTEQYPKGLGETVAPLKHALKAETPVLEKTSFGCGGEPVVAEHLKAAKRQQILVCGLEAHVCVNQTVVSLLAQGYQVYLIEDAIGARDERNYHIAMKKLAQLGAIPSCVEMALFELMRHSRHPQFKAVQQLIL
jgi:nicotinamidase-related amidase